MTKEFADKYPLNAGMTIDCKNKSVKFRYPNRLKGHWYRWAFSVIFPTVMVSYFLAMVGIMLLFSIGSLVFAVLTTSISFSVIQLASFDLSAVVQFFFLAFLMFGVPVISTLVIARYYKYFSKIFPRYNYMFLRLFHRLYKIEVKQLNSLEYEIPLFSNVFLDYKAKGEFAEYLDTVKIVEHPFKYADTKTRKNNETLWRAIFSFSAIPKTGKLVVNFI